MKVKRSYKHEILSHPRFEYTMKITAKSKVSFHGSTSVDISLFLFAYENLVMRGTSNGNKLLHILCHIDDAAFLHGLVNQKGNIDTHIKLLNTIFEIHGPPFLT